jgi:Spy/CpxP family protein refolding chaperone
VFLWLSVGVHVVWVTILVRDEHAVVICSAAAATAASAAAAAAAASQALKSPTPEADGPGGESPVKTPMKELTPEEELAG